MKIYSWNVNGIRAMQNKGLIDWINEEQPEILCLQEIKAKTNQLDEELLKIPGYYSFFNSAERKGYSGVCIYTKIKPKNVLYNIGIEEFDKEGRVISLEFQDFILFNIYFPNGQKDDERLDYKMRFYDEYLGYFGELKSQGKKLVICGDFNTAHNEIDLKNPKENSKRSGFLPIEREWMDKFISNGYIDTFRYLHSEEVKYSWWSYRFNARQNNAGWRIDYHFISEGLIDNLVNSEIYDEIQGSDHCPVVLTLDFKRA